MFGINWLHSRRSDQTIRLFCLTEAKKKKYVHILPYLLCCNFRRKTNFSREENFRVLFVVLKLELCKSGFPSWLLYAEQRKLIGSYPFSIIWVAKVIFLLGYFMVREEIFLYFAVFVVKSRGILKSFRVSFVEL